MKVIKRTDAFYIVRLPGTLPVDESSRQSTPQIDTTNFIYVETSLQNIIWQEAIIQGRTYTIVAEKLGKEAIDIGYDKTTQQNIRITPADSNYLWRLTFKPKQSSDIIPNDHLILIKAKVEGKSISISGNSRKEIVLPELNQ